MTVIWRTKNNVLASVCAYEEELRRESGADTLRLRHCGGNEFPQSHTPLDTFMQMPCHPEFSLDQHREGQEAVAAPPPTPPMKNSYAVVTNTRVREHGVQKHKPITV